MEAQLQRPYGTSEEQLQHTGIHPEGEVEQQPEKKSMLKKVKAKARKIKDSIKNIGHENVHDQAQHDDQEEEEDEDEEMEDAPEVHGAPIYDSSAIKTGVLPHQDVGMAPKSGLNLDHPTSRTEAPKSGLNLGHPTSGTEVPYSDLNLDHPTSGTQAPKSGLNLDHPTSGPETPKFGLNLDHPTSGTEVPKSDLNLDHPTSGNEDRSYSNDPLHPIKEGREEHGGLERTEREVGEKFGVLTDLPAEHSGHALPAQKLSLEEDPQAPTDKPNPSNYESKVTDPTAHAAEADVSPLVASLGKITVEDEPRPKSTDQATEQRNSLLNITGEDKTKPTEERISFGKMLVEDETKPNSFGETDEQKRSFTGSHDQFAPQELPTSTEFIPESIPKQFNSNTPEEEMPRDTIHTNPPADQETSSYTDKISSAAYVIADKAVSAKNVVASKLGYGGATEEQGSPTDSAATKDLGSPKDSAVREDQGSHTDSAATKSPGYAPTEYAQKAVTAVSETLAPVYGKVAGVGSAVASKVPGIAKGDGQESITETPEENKGRGVGMKEYLAEKFRPGEEDKALSEAISDSLNTQMEKTTAMLPGGGGKKPIEKVTESEDVARELGSEQENSREGSDAVIAGSESSGSTVTEKIKNAVTSWVTKGSESPTSHQAPADSSGNNIECS